MTQILPRAATMLACLAFTVGPVSAVTYVWQGGGPVSILDPANWVGGTVPPNDGTNINLLSGDIISFAPGADRTIPDDSGRQINVPTGAQILSASTTPTDRHIINARVNLAGTGPDGNGAIFANGSDWVLPQNTALTGNTLITTNNSRTRIDNGANRLDLAGNTLTLNGTGEFNLVNTNVLNTSGTILANHLFSIEGTTRFDPNVSVDVAPNQLYTSWGGRSSRRESPITLRNNAVIETRHEDRDLTFTGPITINSGDTGILRAQIQATGQTGDGTDMRLVVMGSTTGAGAVRAVGNGTLVLNGNNTHTGGTTLAQTGAASLHAASNNALGTGTVTIETPSVINLSNAGGEEYRDSAARDAALGVSTGKVNPTLSALHSPQPFDETRFSYTGKINNTSGGNLVYSFAENYDDEVYLEVDGTVVLNNTAWEVASSGQITLSPGEHDIRVSVRNGTGGAGPISRAEDAVELRWGEFTPLNTIPKGVGISTTLPLGGATTNRSDYASLGGGFQVYQAVDRTIANNFAINQPLTLSTVNMNGYKATLSGALSGPSNVVVQGSPDFTTDQLILSGAATYAGNTTVEAGANLQRAGSQTTAAEYNIQNGGTVAFLGTLTVGDPAAPGVGSDLLITNNGQAAFTSTATLALDIFADLAGTQGTAENDQLLTGGTLGLTLSGTLVVNNPNNINTFGIGDQWDLFQWNTAPTGTFTAINLPTLPTGLSWNTSDVYNSGIVSVVPEPTTGALLSLCAGAVLLRRRRQRQ